MKKAIVLLVVLFLSGAGMMSAQKIGHVNYQELITSLPEYKSIQDSIDKEKALYEKELIEESQKLKDEEASYNMKKKTNGFPTPESEQLALKRLNEHARELEELSAIYDQKLNERYMALLKPLQDKVKDAITKVAKAQNIGYVLDISQQIALVIDGNDLTAAVRKELGLPEKAEVKNP